MYVYVYWYFINCIYLLTIINNISDNTIQTICAIGFSQILTLMSGITLHSKELKMSRFAMQSCWLINSTAAFVALQQFHTSVHVHIARCHIGGENVKRCTLNCSSMEGTTYLVMYIDLNKTTSTNVEQSLLDLMDLVVGGRWWWRWRWRSMTTFQSMTAFSVKTRRRVFESHAMLSVCALWCNSLLCYFLSQFSCFSLRNSFQIRCAKIQKIVINKIRLLQTDWKETIICRI